MIVTCDQEKLIALQSCVVEAYGYCITIGVIPTNVPLPISSYMLLGTFNFKYLNFIIKNLISRCNVTFDRISIIFL